VEAVSWPGYAPESVLVFGGLPLLLAAFGYRAQAACWLEAGTTPVPGHAGSST
jgi:hypothetical protein